MRTGLLIALGIIIGSTLSTFVAMAWTAPTANPPGANVSSPVNVGGTMQLKNGTLGVNALGVFGNTILNGVDGDGIGNGVNSYLNFGATPGQNGYGVRDNAGILEFKNNGGSWATIQSTVFTLMGGGTAWTTSGTNIYNANSGNVGVGTNNPVARMQVSGDANSVLSQAFGDWQNNGQLFVTGAANTSKRLALGVDTSASPMVGVIQSIEAGVLARSLALNPSGGNVGINNNAPAAPLSVNTTIKIGQNVAGGVDQFDIGNSSGNAYLYAYSTSNTSASLGAYGSAGLPLILNPSGGNVGVGTASPGEKLEVAGNAYISGSYLRFPHAYGNSDDGKIGNSMFAPGLDIVGINNDNTYRKIQTWGSIIQNQNDGGNSFSGNTTFAGNLTLAGSIVSGGMLQTNSGGVKFPDGSTQTTAAGQITIYSHAAGSWYVASNQYYYSDAFASCPAGTIATGGGGSCDATQSGPPSLIVSQLVNATTYKASCMSDPVIYDTTTYTITSALVSPGGTGANASVYCMKQ